MNKHIRTISFPQVNNGTPLKVYSLNSFLNTLEGNNLYARGDMKAYKAAKAKFDEAKPDGGKGEKEAVKELLRYATKLERI